MDYTSIKVGQLPSAAIAGSNLIPHEVGGLLKKATITDLAAFISANGAVGFRAVSVPNGGTLPSTTQQEFILVGPGTYNNVGGGSPVTVTEELNALVSNGTFWFIGVQIPIDAAAGGTANWGGITGTLSAQTDLQTALNNRQPSSADLSSIAGLTGTTGLLRKTAANTYSLDTNTYVTGSGTTNFLPKFTSSNALGNSLISDNGTAVGINGIDVNPTPGEAIHIFNFNNDAGNGGNYLIQGTAYANSTGQANVHIRKARGTMASPSAVLSGDYLVSFGFRGYDGSNFAQSSAAIQAIAEENFTTTKNGTSILFQTTPLGNYSANRVSSLKLEASGNGRFFKDLQIDGKLGVGTLTPNFLIHINGSGANSYMQFTSATTGTTSSDGLLIGTGDSGDAVFLNRENTNMQFYTNNTERMRITSGGRVGIGTTNPSGIFQVNDSNTNRLIINADNGVFTIGSTSGGFYVNNVNNVASLFTILNNGNVGIGTTSPTQRLDVNGLINSTNGISVGGSGVSVVWTGTQAAYDAITTKSSTTIYFIQ
jgi:hypothetical protein